MSGLSRLERLMYTIGVVDRASGPVNQIMNRINQLSQQTAGAQETMMRGFVGAAGGAMMLVGSLNPAIAANQALGEVSSLGVADSSLQQLNNTAINFTAKYGGNASEVISASYDIQSSIAGLTGEELSAFTNASAVMAKGTKADASTATNYLGTMYGIYQDNAKAMGKNTWVEQLAGQTATAVRMFKTNGTEMSGAFTSLGASAKSHGIEMAESMAVLGQLQATMSGSEAGTKYKAFLAGVGNAQKALGIQLTDTMGKLLPMPQVLDRLSQKFGDMNMDTVAKSGALSKAFGSGEATALIELLLPQVSQLKNNIQDLNQQTGMQTAIDMADAQTTAWDRLSGGFNAVATSLGQAVLPIIEPVIELLAMMLNGVRLLSDHFPLLTGVAVTLALTVVGAMIAMSAFNIISGLTRFGMVGLSSVTQTYAFVMNKATMAINWGRRALLHWQYQVIWSGGVLAGLKAMFISATASAWAFTSALLANPLTWVALSVIVLATIIYKYWGPISAFLSGFWDGFKQGFSPVITLFSGLGSVFAPVGELFSWLGSKVGELCSWFTRLLSPVNACEEALMSAGKTGANFGEVIGSAVSAFFGMSDDVQLDANLTKNVSSTQQTLTQPQDLTLNKALAANDMTSGNLASVHDITSRIGNVNQRAQQIASGDSPSMTSINERIAQVNHNATQFTPQNLSSVQEVNQKIDNANSSAKTINANVTRRVERSSYLQSLSSSNNTNNQSSTDNSKRVYIDNLTLQSDSPEQTAEYMMELAG
ncbi:phage tail tape measure protein [Shewanella surugensis]|uniref:Phage tail tape measure protein n=1 Tax=Shewanella surugensis TaxID=212020 RepID=A0ABT0L6I2_9GAMM|nr:phage tail tape measure protein [Shewanella surugensis]MCL1123301.1 phage tail tape measure protein [Shewanella surugensis]